MLDDFWHLVNRNIFVATLAFAVLGGAPTLNAAPNCSQLFDSNAVDSLLKKSERPTTEEIIKISTENIFGFLKPLKGINDDPRFYNVLEEVTTELLETSGGRQIFFVARDGEWFYDAMTMVIRRFPETVELVQRIHLLNLSRPVALNTQADTLMAYLKANNLEIDQILEGKSRVILVDTGERGSIFIALLQKIVQTNNFNTNDWKRRLENLLFGFEVKLLHSSVQENRTELIKKWQSMDKFEATQIISDLTSLGFAPLIEGKHERIGIPSKHWDLHSWIVKEFERKKHWNGRATAVDSSGKVSSYQDIDNDHPQALHNQARIIAYFSQNDTVKRLHGFIQTALNERLVGYHDSYVIEPAGPSVIIQSGIEIPKGAIAVTPSKSKYQVLQFIDKGKRGSVYQAKSLENGQLVALKIGVDNDAETLKSFAEEAEKTKGYVLADVPHPKVIELGANLMVKEFINGTRADQWLQAWFGDGMPTNTPQMKNLSELLKKAAKKNVYIGDLNPKNLIWDGVKWVIVDSGSWRNDLSEKEALDRYDDKVVSRWSKHFSKDLENRLSSELGLKEK